MKISECCGAVFSEPGHPDNDICSCCSEHADPIEEEEPSIEVIEIPDTTEQNKWKRTTPLDSRHFKGERR